MIKSKKICSGNYKSICLKSFKNSLTTNRFQIKERLKKSKKAEKITNLSFIQNRKQMNFQSQLD